MASKRHARYDAGAAIRGSRACPGCRPHRAMRSLALRHDFAAEGKVMQHCVDYHAARVGQAGEVVLSLQRGTACSTLRLRVRGGMYHVERKEDGMLRATYSDGPVVEDTNGGVWRPHEQALEEWARRCADHDVEPRVHDGYPGATVPRDMAVAGRLLEEVCQDFPSLGRWFW